jgi:hypothetical protein
MTAPLTLTRLQAHPTPPRRPTPRPSAVPAQQTGRGRTRDQGGVTGDDRQRIAATASSLAVACLEILSGVRRCESIARWVEPELLAKLDHRAQLRAEVAPNRAPSDLGGPPVVQPGAAQVCRVSPDVAEVTVVVRTPSRFRAVAVRLELLTTRWTMTALQTM